MGSKVWQSEDADPPRVAAAGSRRAQGPKQRADAASDGGHRSPAPTDTPRGEGRQLASVAGAASGPRGPRVCLWGLWSTQGLSISSTGLSVQPTKVVPTPTSTRAQSLDCDVPWPLRQPEPEEGPPQTPWHSDPAFCPSPPTLQALTAKSGSGQVP